MIKLSNIIRSYVATKQLLSLHSVMNKITGLLLFLLPFTLSFVDVQYSAIVVCSIATFAAIQEGISID